MAERDTYTEPSVHRVHDSDDRLEFVWILQDHTYWRSGRTVRKGVRITREQLDRLIGDLETVRARYPHG